MKLWMDVMRDLDPLLGDVQPLYDAWAAGGVEGLVVGPLSFHAAKLLPGARPLPGSLPPRACFDPNPAVYARYGVEPPPPPERTDPELRRALERALVAAKDRGWAVWIFQPVHGAPVPAGAGHPLIDPRARDALLARAVDTLAHFSMADGAVLDGPEWGYEIAPHHMDHRSYIFHDLPPSAASRCSELGYDYAELVAAMERLHRRLHELDPARVALHAGGGLLGAFHLLGADPHLLAWMRFRADALTEHYRAFRHALDAELDRPVKLAVGPRTAAFAPLCGYDFARLAEFVDVLLPKHYFWHRGFDGLLGTVYRYVETLTAWSPRLSDADALAVVEALCGLRLPGVSRREDLEDALTPAFFEGVVAHETCRALAAVDDPRRVVPWVEAGRNPHDGDPMPPGQLRQLLLAAQGAGLQRFLYHHQGNLTAGEWAVISELCGEPWRSLESNYRPADEPVL